MNQFLKMHDKAIWESKGYWFTYLPYEDGNRLIKKRKRGDLQQAIIKFYSGEDITFGRMVIKWLDSKLENREIYKQSYDKYLMTYNKYFQPLKNKVFKDITPIELETFIRATIRDNELTAKQWSDVRIIINGVFSFGKYDASFSISQFMGDLQLSPKMFRKTYKADSEEVFSIEEENKLREQLFKERDNVVALGILLAMGTGLRVGELCALKYEDLDNDILHVRRTEVHYKLKKGKQIYEVRESTKGAKGYRDIIILEEDANLIKYIRSLNPASEYLFFKDGKRVKSGAFMNKLARECKSLSLPPKSMHKLRKTYLTKLIDAGVKPSVIKEQLGHTEMQTSIDYYYRNNVTHYDAVNSIKNAISLGF